MSLITTRVTARVTVRKWSAKSPRISHSSSACVRHVSKYCTVISRRAHQVRRRRPRAFPPIFMPINNARLLFLLPLVAPQGIPGGGGGDAGGGGDTDSSDSVCHVWHCSRCSFGSNYCCQTCDTGYTRTGCDCSACSDPTSCRNCDVSGPGKCDECKDGHFLLHGQCHACSSGCRHCSSELPSDCKACFFFYDLASANDDESAGGGCVYSYRRLYTTLATIAAILLGGGLLFMVYRARPARRLPPPRTILEHVGGGDAAALDIRTTGTTLANQTCLYPSGAWR